MLRALHFHAFDRRFLAISQEVQCSGAIKLELVGWDPIIFQIRRTGKQHRGREGGRGGKEGLGVAKSRIWTKLMERSIMFQQRVDERAQPKGPTLGACSYGQWTPFWDTG